MTTVILDKVSKVFAGGTGAVREVSLEVRAGEFFTLLGPSGCGKTTTLRMVAGFTLPTAGRILFDGRDVTYLPPNQRDTGMVFQNYALFPHLTVFENVAFGLRVRRVPRDEVQRRVREALATVRLAGMEDRRVDQLSGGQQQRVALARALVIRPRVLLLDEPLSNLDAKLREETRAEIRRIQQQTGLTAIYVTHDQAEALAVSDRIAVMEGGRVHQVGTPQEVYHRPATAFVATFLGKNNLIPATCLAVEGGQALVRVASRWLLRVPAGRANPGVQVRPGAALTLAIRPEALALASEDAGNAVEGQVTGVEFGGALVEYRVDCGPFTLIAHVAAGEGDLIQPGQTVRLHLPPHRIFLLE